MGSSRAEQPFLGEDNLSAPLFPRVYIMYYSFLLIIL